MAASPDEHDPEVPPPSRNHIDDPGHWRSRAKEAHTKAEQATDPVERTLLLEAAKHYEDLAEVAELRLREKR